MAMDGQTHPSVTSDKTLGRQIRVNAMLTSDRVKPELLCSWWLPRRCHVGWLDISFHYIARVADHTALWGARTVAIGARMAGDSARTPRRVAPTLGEGCACLDGGAHTPREGARTPKGGAQTPRRGRARLGRGGTHA
jgi:hypothetical protein